MQTLDSLNEYLRTVSLNWYVYQFMVG